MLSTKDIFSILKSPMERIINSLDQEVRHIFSNRLLEYQIGEFEKNFLTKTFLHRLEARPILEIFEPMTLLPLNTNERSNHMYFSNEIIKSVSAKHFFNRFNKSIITGNAGSGKSFLIKFLFSKCVLEEYKLPIKVELRYLNDYNGTLQEYIYGKIFEYNKLGASQTITERLLESGNCVFFFDGFDELKLESKSKRLKELEDFTGRFNANTYLITSRPHTNIEQLSNFFNFKISPLSKDDIVSFIIRQVQNSSEFTTKIIDTILAPNNSSYLSYLTNPLLLSMFIFTFEKYGHLPQKKSEFYYQVFDTLYSTHDSLTKLYYTRNRESELPKEDIVKILNHFSYISFFKEKFFFSKMYFDECLNEIKLKQKELKFENDKLIYDYSVGIGILMLDGIEYAFPHRSLQEYFTSLAISDMNTETKKIFYSKLADRIFYYDSEISRLDNLLDILVETDTYEVAEFFIIQLLYNIGKVLSLDKTGISYDTQKEYIIERAGNYINFITKLLKKNAHFENVFLLTSSLNAYQEIENENINSKCRMIAELLLKKISEHNDNEKKLLDFLL